MRSSLRGLVRVIAIVLLAWTTFDLADPQCCLREILPIGSAATLSAGGHSTQGSQPDGDDCFCCARCIDTGIRTPMILASGGWTVHADPLAALATRASALDHPPQNP